MKMIRKSLLLVAAAAMGFTACQKEIQEEVPADKGTVVISFVADAPDTKTSVNTDGDAPVFTWDENEEFVVLEQTDKLAVASSVAYEKNDEGKAMIKATFDANSGHLTYDYVTVYPAGGYVNAESIDAATLSLPAVQTMAEGSYDPDADLMVSRVVTADAQPTEAQMVGFTRLAAVVKMTLKGLELEAGDEVEQVIFTAAGKNLAGTVNANLNDPHAFTVAEGVDNVTVNTTSSTEVYFTVLPTTLEEGNAYTVTVITNEKLYVRTGTIGEDKTLSFQAGMVTRFGVNMAGVAPSEKWVLVRDASTLEENDIVTIAAANNNFVLGCSFYVYSGTLRYPYASYTDVVKFGDYLYHPIVTDKTEDQYMLQKLILSKQDPAKAAFEFYNGEDYEGDDKTGYLTNAVTDNYLQLSSYPSKNSAFEISVTDGVATIEAKESEWDNVLLKFYNSNPNYSTSTYRRFVCIDAASVNATKHDDVCIYRLAGAKGVVPTAGAVVTVPDVEEPVVVPLEGVAEETVFEGVKFTYVGDWNISVSDNAEWLTVNYADGVLSYTAEANDDAVRNATVTITASHEGETSKEWPFSVVQKGAPVKVSIDQFNNKPVDPNVEYEVTGILTKKSTSDSGDNKISDADGNSATFTCIDMVDGTKFKDDKTIELGDIVTFVAAVSKTSSSGSTGGSSSARALCKGYYNLSATVEEDLVEYDGGSVVVKLKKSGTLPHGVITCTDDADFAEVEYDPDTYEATVTLEANDGAPRQAVVTFDDGYASASVAVVQGADTAKGNTWELVTDASTLAVGDQVIIAAKDYDVAMSPTIISNKGRSAVAVTKLGNYFLTPTDDVQTLVLGKGSVNGTFAFYDGDNKGFLVSSSTSSLTYKLDNQAYIDANTSFTITIVDGIATIGNKEGTYSSCKFGYHASNKCFFSGTSTSQSKVCLYRLVGVEGEIPVTPADITIPSKSVVVPEEGAVEATAINDVVFNYVGDWNISATSEADWITFAFDKNAGKLTYTAAANEGVVRETSATITATMDGQESKTWTFNLLQKGKPMEITCDALNDKVQNVNVSYKLTGRVVSIAPSSGGTFVLDDGSGRQAEIRYLYTEDNSKQVYDNAEIDLAVGDVVTVTTIVYTKGKGGHGSYHSAYKGHYRLTATADVALISNEGGTVNFDIATSGNVPAGAIVEGSVAEDYDFVTFNYTSGSSAATATFDANNGAGRNATFNFTFGLASVSVTIGQLNDPSVKKGWFLVTDVNELNVGDQVIIAAKSPDGTLDYAISSTSSTSGFRPSKEISLMGNSISDVNGVQKYTLENGHADYSGTWAFKGASDSKYLYVTSSSLKVTSTLDNGGSWAVAIAKDGKATLTSQTTSSYTMMLNWTTSNQTFSVYKPTQTGKGAIYLYKYYE